MIIECKKRAEGYKPVKGNEKEIINHLLDHYGRCCVEKNEEAFSFNIPYKQYFSNDETTFFKLEKDGEIRIAKDKYNFKNYAAVVFDMADEDVLKIFQDPNFMSFKRDGTIDLILKNWSLKTTTETFSVSYNDIIIFDENGKIVDCLMSERDKPSETLLASNDYIVERDVKKEGI